MTWVRTVRRGVVAGAAGTAVLNAVTYGDMLLRGRAASTMPERTVEGALEALGTEVPGSRKERKRRLTALGALSGTAVGVGLGVGGAAARDAGVRVPFALDAVGLGAAAMAATDLPAALLGVEDPRRWTTSAWVSDAVPHLAYGTATATALRLSERGEAPRVRPDRKLLIKSALLGLAAGGRSSLGAAMPALTSAATGKGGRAAAALAIAGELTADKLPAAPPRTQPGALAGRAMAGAAGATALAGREHANATAPAAVAAGAAVAGSFAGLAWRTWSARRRADWHGAVAEDVVAVALAWAVCRRPFAPGP